MKKYCFYLLCVVTTFLCSCSSSDDDSNNAGSMTPTEITAIMKGSWGVHGTAGYEVYNYIGYELYSNSSKELQKKVEGDYQGVIRLLDDGKYKFTVSEMSEDLRTFIGSYNNYLRLIINKSGVWEILKKEGESYLVLDYINYFKIYNLSKDGFMTTFSGENDYEAGRFYKLHATMNSYGHE